MLKNSKKIITKTKGKKRRQTHTTFFLGNFQTRLEVGGKERGGGQHWGHKRTELMASERAYHCQSLLRCCRSVLTVSHDRTYDK